MFCFLRLCFGTLVRLFRSRHSLLLENLALRQQLVVLKRRHPHPKAGLVRQAFLAARSSMLVRLETVSPRRHTRNGCPLAPRRVPLVLENDFEAQKPRRSKTDIERRFLSLHVRAPCYCGLARSNPPVLAFATKLPGSMIPASSIPGPGSHQPCAYFQYPSGSLTPIPIVSYS